MPDSQQYSWTLYLMNNVEDIVVFIGLKALILIILKSSCSRNTQVICVEKLISLVKIINIDF